jgi:hypothetical protein
MEDEEHSGREHLRAGTHQATFTPSRIGMVIDCRYKCSIETVTQGHKTIYGNCDCVARLLVGRSLWLSLMLWESVQN